MKNPQGRTWRATWKKKALIMFGGGVLLQTGGCATTFAPVALSLAESVILTYLFGRGP